MTIDQIAEAAIERVKPAVIRELEVSKASVLAKLGPVERMVVGRNWMHIEAEAVRILQAVAAEGVRLMTGLS